MLTPIRSGVVDISNAAEATISGVELEAAGAIVPGLRLGGHLAWLDASYDRYVALDVGGVTGDVAGNRLNNAPEWSGRLWLERSQSAGRLGKLSLRAASRWQSTIFFTPFNDAVQRQSPSRSARAERGAWAAALHGLAIRAQPDRRGLHHRQLRLAAAGNRRTSGAAAGEWGVRLAVRWRPNSPDLSDIARHPLFWLATVVEQGSGRG